MYPTLHTLIISVALVFVAMGSMRAQNPIPPAPLSPTASRTSSTQGVLPTTPSSSGELSPESISTGVSASGDYVLSPADTVEMTVFHEPDLATKAHIANDGSVQFPLIGELKIGGLAVRDARELIRKRYNADYLVEPQVYLNVTEYAQRKFTILGQVAKPGTYTFPGGEHLSLLEAIGTAGGFTRIADKGAVSVKRTEHGPEQMLKINA